MKQIAGISFKKDFPFFGKNRYLRIDLKQHGDNQLLEDFLDLLDVEARKDEPTYPLREVLEEENKRRGINV